jgi:tetratricopeptide (TPR) repeat protein
MAVYFPEEIVLGASVPRSDILDRRETDFKTDELVVRQDDNPVASPKSMELLRQGEALYSRGLYHEAVHVWTRILFLDRGNPQARLRIDKAKEAVAERERRLDADLAEARALFESGNLREARERVRSVLAADGGHSEAVALEAAIEALDRRNDPPRETDVLAGVTTQPAMPAKGAAVPATPAQGVVFRVPKVSRPSSGRSRPAATSRLQMTAFVLVSLSLFAAALLYVRENWDTIVSDGAYAHPAGLAPTVLPERLTASVPDLSQLRYYNGQRLFAQGRYREALAELRLVDRDSSVGSEARGLVLRIEERLLRDPAGPEPAEAPR